MTTTSTAPLAVDRGRPSLTEMLNGLVPARHRVDAAAGVVLLIQMVLYGLVAFPGSFYLDDLVATGRAASSDLNLSYLRGPEGHHLAPGSMLWFWVQAHLFPLNHAAGVTATLLLQAVVTVAMWRLLRSLFGARPLALVPLTLFALTPLSVPTFAWWIQSVCLLPVSLSIIGATYQHVAYLRTRRLPHALGAGAWVVFGLLFWEKAVLAVVLPVLLTLVCSSARPLRARLGELGRLWPAWLSLGLPVLAFVAIYSRQERQPARSVGAGHVASLLWESTTRMVLPSLLGGPWRWTTKEFYGIARPTTLEVALSGAVVLVLVLLSLRRRPGAWRGWLLLALYIPASLAPIAAGRLAQYGDVVGRDSRYVTDIAIAAAVAVGLVLLPVLSGREVQPEEVAAPVRPSPWRRAAVVTMVLAFLISTTISSANFAIRWHDNPTGAYIAQVRQGLDRSQGSVPLFDAGLPSSVLGSFYAPHNRISNLVGQLPGEARFEDGLTPLQFVREDGTIVAGRLVPGVKSLPGPSGACGYAVTADVPDVRVPFGRTVPDFVDRTIRVELLLGAPTAVRVEVGNGSRRRIDDGRILPRGPAAIVALVPGGALDAIDVGGLAPGAFACVLSITVGKPGPVAPG